MCERSGALILQLEIHDAAATVPLRRTVCSLCLVDLILASLSFGYL